MITLFAILSTSEKMYISDAGGWQYTQLPDMGVAKKIVTPNHKLKSVIEQKINTSKGYKISANNFQTMDSLFQEL